jgi:hypothetical protein
VTQTASSAMLPRAERLLMFSFVVAFLFVVAYCMLLLYADMAHVKNKFWRIELLFSACVNGCEERGVKKVRMEKSKKNKNKAKLNLTVRDEQRRTNRIRLNVSLFHSNRTMH